MLAAARSDGNTATAARRLASRLAEVQLVDLQALGLPHFDYLASGQRDDFLSVVDLMGVSDTIVFATPVYWYAMSAQLKTFFDRLSDLLLDPERRPTGRALAGRDLWVLATGTDPELPEGFDVPFARTADYFDMRWRESRYVACSSDRGPLDGTLAIVDDLAARIAEGG